METRFEQAADWTTTAATETAVKIGDFAGRTVASTREVAPLVRELLIPVTVIPFIMAAWSLGADLRLTGEFPLPGIMSRWMVWTGIGLVFYYCASRLNAQAHKSGEPSAEIK
jgi:hypothetical protein